MVEYIKGTLYSCECGYKTITPHHACKHSKTKKCSGKTIEKRDVEFVLKEDHLVALGNATSAKGNVTVIGGDSSTNIADSSTHIDNSTHTEKALDKITTENKTNGFM